MDPSVEAALSQHEGGYAADTWITIKLEPMTKLWQGIGGSSNFFVSEEDARQAKGSYSGTHPFRLAQTLWRLAQVKPNATLGFRKGIREFVVDFPTPAAIGICRNNPGLGSGSVLQYYIPNWERYLQRTGREFNLDAAGRP